MINIACLHTAASNIAIFDDAARQLNLTHLQLSHLVMPHLLAEAEASGGLTAGLYDRLVMLLQDLQPHFDVILITCSTLGPVSAAFFPLKKPCAVWRTDGMLAKAVHSNEKKRWCFVPLNPRSAQHGHCSALTDGRLKYGLSRMRGSDLKRVMRRDIFTVCVRR